jgi:hypothetical protein
MALDFKKYESTESTLETLGTIKSIIGDNGKIGYVENNLKDSSRRVVVVLKKEDGTSTIVTCSKKVSDGIRNSSIELGHLINFEIVQGDAGVPFISAPASSMLEVEVKNIVSKPYGVSSTVLTQETIDAMLAAI